MSTTCGIHLGSAGIPQGLWRQQKRLPAIDPNSPGANAFLDRCFQRKKKKITLLKRLMVTGCLIEVNSVRLEVGLELKNWNRSKRFGDYQVLDTCAMFNCKSCEFDDYP